VNTKSDLLREMSMKINELTGTKLNHEESMDLITPFIHYACDEAMNVIKCIKPAYSTDTESMIDKEKVALAITARLK